MDKNSFCILLDISWTKIKVVLKTASHFKTDLTAEYKNATNTFK